MKRFLAYLAILTLCLCPSYLQASGVDIPLFASYDVDTPTENTDVDQVVTVTALVDGPLTILANPDVPRVLTITIADAMASVNAGTVTVVGTDVNGKTLTWAQSIAAGAATYTSTVIFSTVASATVASAAVLGGDETITIGVSAGATTPLAYIYCRLGPTQYPAASGRIKTTGSSTTVAEYTTSGGPFSAVAVGDELSIDGPAGHFVRYVRARASAASITVDTAADLSATGGYTFTFKHHECGYSDDDGWVSCGPLTHPGLVSVLVKELAAGANGILFLVQGRARGALERPYRISAFSEITSPMVIGGDGATGTATYTMQNTGLQPTQVRVGSRFTAYDDSDAVPDSVSVDLTCLPN